MRRNFTILILSLGLFSCSNPSNDLQDTQWLIGTWEYAFNQSIEMETWNKKEHELRGTGLFISLGDSVPMRKMGIISENGKLVLVIQEESFEYISKYHIEYLGKDSLVAVSHSNVWPQRIIYTKPDANHLHKHMSGKQQQMNNSVTSYYTLKK